MLSLSWSFDTDVHAAPLAYKVVAAPSTAGVAELLAGFAGCFVVIARDGSRTLPPVQHIQAQHRKALVGTAVFIAECEVLKAVGIALAAAIVKRFALHGGHVEEIPQVEGTARAHLLVVSAYLWDFWDPKARLLALLVTLEVVGVPLASSVVKLLAFLREGVVIIPLQRCLARPLVHSEKTHVFIWTRKNVMKRTEERTQGQ